MTAAFPGSAGWSADEPWETARARVLISSLSLLALATGIAGHLLGGGPAQTLGLAIYLLFGVGAAPWALASRMGLSLRLALSVGASMTILVLVSMVMLNGGAWHPAVAAAVVFGLTAPVHVAGLVRAARDLPPSAITLRPTSPATLTLASAGAALCAVAALTHRHLEPGAWGFLPHIGPLWYAGLALLLVSIAMARGADEVGLAVAVTLLTLTLTGTAALVYDGPRSQSAAKHVEFVEQIRHLHYLHSTVNVYNSWPGYFSAMAWLADVAGLRDSIGLATGWPVVAGLLRVVSMRFLAGRLIEGKTLPWLAVALGVLADPIGADYFSPQSVGFVLGLVVFGLALSGLATLPKIAAITAVSTAIVVSHQLSPYLIGGILVFLVLFGQLKPWWLPATVLGLAVVWLLMHWGDVVPFLSFDAIGKADNFRAPAASATAGLHRQPIVGYTVIALVAGILLVGFIALSVLTRRVRQRRVWAIAMTPVVGIGSVVVNPYGNEGIFRAALFALPWLSILAAMAFTTMGERRIHVPVLATTVALAVTFNVAAFGLDATNVLRPADRTALHVFLRTPVPAGQVNFMMIIGPGVPNDAPPIQALTHVTVARSDFDLAQGFALTAEPPEAEMQRMTDGLTEYAAEYAPGGSALYAIWTPMSDYFGWEYGMHTRSQFGALRAAFMNSGTWKPVFDEDGTVLFRYSA